jgi:hypothetical protein
MRRSTILLLLLGFAGLWWLAHLGSASKAAVGGKDFATGTVTACRVLQVPMSLSDAMQTEQAAPAFRAGNATITPLAGFSVAARVLAREDYHLDRESDYAPTDLALGWGPMSAPGLAERLDVSQGARFYRYHWGGEGPPMAPDLIATHSANMHMVPANAEVARKLRLVHANDGVRLDGWLIRIDADDGWHWQSSLTREDSGAGACELLLVCAVDSVSTPH